jgi:hypothetical protein
MFFVLILLRIWHKQFFILKTSHGKFLGENGKSQTIIGFLEKLLRI